MQTVGVVIESMNMDKVTIGTATISNGGITTVSISNDQVFYAPRDISNVLYTASTGLTTVTTATAHGLTAEEEVVVSGIAFTCNYTGSGPVNVTNAVYDNVTGIMTVTTATAHNLNTSGQRSDVILTGLAFTCGLDGGSSTHVYPRTTDPAYCGTSVLSTPTTTTFKLMLAYQQFQRSTKVEELHNLLSLHLEQIITLQVGEILQ